MGTRADFYVGRGTQAEWLGSIALDGYPDGISDEVKGAATEADYRAAIVKFFAARKDATLPEQGWPWPWEDSNLTDYAYAFDDGKVWAHGCGGWFLAIEPEPEADGHDHAEWPNMKDRQRVTLGPRSGLIVLVGGKTTG